MGTCAVRSLPGSQGEGHLKELISVKFAETHRDPDLWGRSENCLLRTRIFLSRGPLDLRLGSFAFKCK